METCQHISGLVGRTVGDPVDVVSGANLDWNRDFRLIGPLPLEWCRHYDSSRNTRLGALGWGRTHDYDRYLLCDVDGIRYVTPVGKVIGFPPLAADGDEAAQAGVVLQRVTARTYQAHERGHPVMEFDFDDYQSPARLVRVFRDNAAIRFFYSQSGFLERIVDSLGRRIRVDHAPDGRVLGLTLDGAAGDKQKTLLVYRYDPAGNLVEGIDPYKHSFRFRYDRNNRVVAKTDRRGYTFSFEYDAEGRCVYSGGQDDQFAVRLRYLSAERVTVVTKADEGQWTYFYDENQALTQIIDPYGGVRKFQADDRGRLGQETDPNGNVTRFVYDEAGGLAGKISPLGRYTAIPEDPDAPDPWEHRVPEHPAQYEYGYFIRRQDVSLPASDDPVLEEVPDFARRFIRTVPPNKIVLPLAKLSPGLTSSDGYHETADGRVFDDFGTLLKWKGAKGDPQRWVYDAEANVQRFHDHDGATYAFEYTSWNLCSRTIDPLGTVVSYRYTPTRQLAAVVDGEGNVTEYAYDHKDRLIRVKRNGVIREEYDRDPADNLIGKRDGKGQTLLTFEIGPRNLKTVRRLATGENHYFAYDDRGRVVRAATDDFEVLLAYDKFNNQTEDKRDGLGVRHSFERLQLVETTVFDKFTTSYRRSRDGNLVIEDPTGREHRLSFLEHGLVVRTTDGGSSEVSQFDPDGRCLVKVHYGPGSTRGAWSRVYEYSGEGDLLQAADSRDGTSQYHYDAAHRLVGAKLSGGKTQAFAYDRAHNLLRQPGLEGVSHQGGNRLATANGDRFEYDNRNHVSARQGGRGTTHYRYDSRDMLVRCETDQVTWEARYDPLGRRVSKTFEGKHTKFYWDSDRLAAEMYDDDSVRVYVYADHFAIVPLLFIDYDSIDADPASGQTYCVFTNQIGAPVLAETCWGEKVWGARLDPYGTAHVDPDSTVKMPLRFPGHYWDPELGLQYNRYRYYSPELGRYLQSDPIGLGGGINVYAYSTSPLSRVDVRGLAVDCPKVPENFKDMTDEEKQAWLASLSNAQRAALMKSTDPSTAAAREALAANAVKGLPDKLLKDLSTDSDPNLAKAARDALAAREAEAAAKRAARGVPPAEDVPAGKPPPPLIDSTGKSEQGVKQDLKGRTADDQSDDQRVRDKGDRLREGDDRTEQLDGIKKVQRERRRGDRKDNDD